MAAPPIPPSLDHLATRPFSFYPAILGVEHNEWLFRRATWSEILVVNCRTGAEIWIPRRFVGEVSPVDDPVLIVGLNRELEYKGGMICPHQRRVIPMPAAGPVLPAGAAEQAAPASGGRMDSGAERRILHLVLGALVVAIVLYVFATNLFRIGPVEQRVTFTGKDQVYLELSGRNDYFAVVQKLGKPASDGWLSEQGEIQYRALKYPDRKYTVILMGSDRKSATYVGTLDDNWRPIHSVELRSGGTTASLLRGLPRF